MAEESVDVPVISEVTMPRVVELRRHSAGKTSSGNNEKNVVPHYLRASTGSCHDFCKYGKKLALEAKKRSFIPKIAERKQLYQSSQVNIGKVVLTSGVKHRSSTDSELEISNASDTSKVIKTGQDMPVQPDNVEVNMKKTSSVKVKQSSLLPKANISLTSKTRKQEILPISKRVGASSMSTSKKEGPLLKSTSQRVKTNPISTSHMAKTSSKSTSKKTRTSSKLSDKDVTSLNLDSCKVASPMASSSSKSSRLRIAGINMHKSLKTALRDKNHPKPRKVEEHYNEADEKTLYVIKIESEDQTLQSDQDIEVISQFSSEEDQEESKYATSELVEDTCLGNNGKENMENLETLDLEIEENEKPQKDGIIDFEDNDCKSLREILVETQIEKSSPRKLKFRRGTVLGGNATDGDETAAITGPEKVVLRHQDVKGKKDEQVLLNNVIEETASKLVETQKSKVKALVGAFETLISLNEKKSYANTFN